MGVQALNAPRVAVMSDWYFERQLVNFRDDVRGLHPQDFYGFQMGLMVQSIYLEQAMKNHIRQALKICNGKIEGKSGAAQLLKLNPNTLRRKMRKMSIPRR